MHPNAEAPPQAQAPPTDGDRPPLQRAFGHAEPDRRDDQNQAGDSEPPSLDESTDLKPGEVAASADTALWSEGSAQDLRDRWREAQLRFVDDPQKAAEATRKLVDEAVRSLTATLTSQRQRLDSWPADGDTEQYRVVVQRYRTFFEHLITL